MKLDLTGIKAVIFDMDGTMVDNTPFHKKAWIEFCKRRGIDLSEEEYFQKISGKRNDAIFKILFEEDLNAKKVSELEEEKEHIYRELFKPFMKEITGLKDFLTKLKTLGLGLAIATTSFEKNRTFILEALAINNLFKVIVGSEHVSRGKPDPEIYLVAAKQLGIEPKKCLAFEDTPSGIKSAKNAGMKVIGVLTGHTKEELKEADDFIKDFTKIEFKD